MGKPKIKVLLTVFLFILSSSLYAENVENLIKTYPEAKVKCRFKEDFDEYIVPLGKVNKNGEIANTLKLQGEIHEITYTVPAERSVLEVFKNYENAFKEAGFEVIFKLSKKEEPAWAAWVDKYFNSTTRNSRCAQDIQYSLHYADDARYIVAKLSRENRDIYVVLCMGKGGWHKYMTIQQDIIITKPMESGIVHINAEAMAEELKNKGHVAIYGIYFDFNKAVLKTESEPVIKEIAKLLKNNPDLKLYVVGHTDNIGDFDYNMKLSKERAEAVINRLVKVYGIEPSRLSAYGVGPLCPVASNISDKGRAKNRRVELVKR